MNYSFIDAQETPPPKDASFLILLVKNNDEEVHSTEDDQSHIFRTIGYNDFDNTGDDLWCVVGWNWYTDEITTTTGEILGWLPMPKIPDHLKETPTATDCQG